MKNLNDFKSFEIPENFIRFLKGGNDACNALDGCIETAIRDGNDFLIDDCNATFADDCVN